MRDDVRVCRSDLCNSIAFATGSRDNLADESHGKLAPRPLMAQPVASAPVACLSSAPQFSAAPPASAPIAAPEMDFPDTIEGFGYHYDADGKLAKIDGGGAFEFKVSASPSYNQKRYEALADLVAEYVQKLLEDEFNFTRLVIPIDGTRDERASYVYASRDAMTKHKLLLIIPGSGQVLPGMWARSLAINKNLDEGTQLPYIRRAVQEGYGIICLNPNGRPVKLVAEYVQKLLEDEFNFTRLVIPIDGKRDERASYVYASRDAMTKHKLLLIIPGSGQVLPGMWARSLAINKNLDEGTQLPYIRRAVQEGYGIICLNPNGRPVKVSGSPEEHLLYVWDHVVERCRAKHVAIVAHSYGGVATVHLVLHRWKAVKKKVFAIALTDSVHSFKVNPAPKKQMTWLETVGKNWVRDTQPVNTPLPLKNGEKDFPTFSTGTPVHEEASAAVLKYVFELFAQRYKTVAADAKK
ncbi:PREDICTED: protein FAM172A-like [Priapulus caudatus]|uniref:Protein FAM172A-like n=1 Tax=Priapulus caudatus TaxID=37621 RepID=A0ABM1E911_PRICU|nr:PREDICTED: protein FAM172A-like [Priapulus caudatus]